MMQVLIFLPSELICLVSGRFSIRDFEEFITKLEQNPDVSLARRPDVLDVEEERGNDERAEGAAASE